MDLGNPMFTMDGRPDGIDHRARPRRIDIEGRVAVVAPGTAGTAYEDAPA